MTVITPALSVVGAVAVIRVAELTTKLIALTPLKRTLVTPTKSVPVMVTGMLAAIGLGEKLVIAGACAKAAPPHRAAAPNRRNERTTATSRRVCMTEAGNDGRDCVRRLKGGKRYK